MKWKTELPKTLMLVAILLSGCMGGDPAPGADAGDSGTSSSEKKNDADSTDAESVRRMENRTESGSADFTMVAVVPGVLSSWTNTQRFDLERPEHLVEARFTLSWSSQTQDVSDEVAFFIEQGSMIEEAYGSGVLELVVTGEQWSSEEATVWIDPYWTNDVKVGAQVDWEWEVQITLIEEVPGTEDTNEGESRGSNRPAASSMT